MRNRAVLGGGAALLVLAGLVIAVSSGDEHAPKRVALFGDSLTFESATYWDTMMNASGRYDAQQVSVPGIAICDLFPEMEDVRDHKHPDIVAFQFVGNDI